MNINNKRKMSSLQTLVKAVKDEKIKMKDCVDMHQFCAFWGAYDVFSYFKDVVVLVHGPFGCLGNRHYLNSMGSYNMCDNKPHLSTNLFEKDIIFGGEQKLIDCIYEVVEKYPDKKIAIITNCCADIIGDDVEGCIDSLPEDIINKILFMNTGGYSGKSYRCGTEMAFKLLASKILINSSCKKVNGNKVNLFLRRWIWDPIKTEEVNEIVRLLKIVGVDINYIFDEDMNYEKLADMRNADLNIALCNFFARGFFEQLEKKYDVPYLSKPAPVGLLSTLEWLNQIVEMLKIKIDVDELTEVKEIEKQRQELVNKIGKGRDCIIWSQTGDRLLTLLRFALELEMNPIIVGVEPYIIKEKINLFNREVLEEGLNAKVFASNYIEDVQELIEDLDNPIIFCNDNFFPENKVFKYRFAHNAIYGLNGVKKMYSEMNAMLDREVSKYSLFIDK